VSLLHTLKSIGLTHFYFIVIVRTVAMGESIRPLAFAKSIIGRKLQTKNNGSLSGEPNKKQ